MTSGVRYIFRNCTVDLRHLNLLTRVDDISFTIIIELKDDKAPMTTQEKVTISYHPS